MAQIVSLVKLAGSVFLKIERIYINLSDCVGIDIEHEANTRKINDRDCVFMYFREGLDVLEYLENDDIGWLDVYPLPNGIQIQILETDDYNYAESVRKIISPSINRGLALF